MLSVEYHNPVAPAIGLRGGHLQTLYSTIFRKPNPLEVEIEQFELSDGDFVDCHWYTRPTDPKAIVVLFHGLEGSYKSPYIEGMMRSLYSRGYWAVIMHFRGCGGRDNRLVRCYHSGDTGDAREWIASLKSRFGDTPIFAIGYSLGANMLLKLLGEDRDLSPLSGAISISAPMELDVCADKMNRGFSKLYQYHLMKHLKKSLLRKYKLHNMSLVIGIDKERVGELKSFWEFDNIYTAPVHGFGNARNYYAKSSAKGYLKSITRPTLIIHALDDPFMTPQILPKKEELSKSIILEVYPHGGHVGFISGSILRPKYWLEERVVEYIEINL